MATAHEAANSEVIDLQTNFAFHDAVDVAQPQHHTQSPYPERDFKRAIRLIFY